jgi:hypothetical protein
MTLTAQLTAAAVVPSLPSLAVTLTLIELAFTKSPTTTP